MKYDAFISYRHLEQDMFVAKGVHKALETVRIPRKIQKETGVKRIKRVFRDQEELPIGSDLTHNIDYALKESGFLIVICSPQTKESLWVMKEIDTFIELHGRENILAVLVDGEPADSFPHQLCVDENGNPVEPLAADVRGKNKSEVKKKIKSESLRLAAAILHCDYDDLKQRHRERRMRRNMSIAAGVGALGVAFGIYNAYNLNRINENYQQKLVNESKVLAATSLDVLADGDRATAGLIALKGLPVEGQERPFVSDCMYALEQATGAYNTGDDTLNDKLLKHELPVKEMKYDAEGTVLMSYDQMDNAYFWDASTGDLLFYRGCEYIDGDRNEVVDLGVNDGRFVIASRKYLSAYNSDGTADYDIQLPGTAHYAAFSRDCELVAVNEFDKIELYSADDGSLKKTFDNTVTDHSFSSKLKFNADNTFLAVSHSADAGESTTCSVINVATGEEKALLATANYILDIRFTVDDCVVFASIDSDSFLRNGDFPMYLQKYDVATGDLKWEKELSYYNYGYNTSYTKIWDRNYTDASGASHPEVLMSGSRKLYTLDADSGELISTFEAPSDIQTFFISGSAANAFVACSEGRLYSINGTTGYTYSDYTVELSTGSIIDVLMGYGRIVVKEYRSPNIKIMSGLADETKEDMEEPGLHVVDYFGSPDESTFVLEAESESGSDKTTYLIYDTDSGTKKASFDIDQMYTMSSFYADTDTVVVPGKRGSIYVYKLSGNKTEEYKMYDSDIITDKYSVSSNKRYLASVESRIVIMDLQTMQVVSDITPEDHFFGGVVTNDGSRIYGYDYDYRFMYLDLATGEQTHLFPEFTVNGVTLSNDDKVAALICTDGMLRIYNTDSFELIDSIEFYGDSTDLVAFSADSDKLFLQGMDLYFKIYDMSDKKLVFSTDGQMLEINEVSYDEQNNTVALSNYTDMFVVDVNGNSFIHRAPLGKIYFPGKQSMICASSNKLYKFRVKTLEDLVKAFRDEFGNLELTGEQKLIYKID